VAAAVDEGSGEFHVAIVASFAGQFGERHLDLGMAADGLSFGEYCDDEVGEPAGYVQEASVAPTAGVGDAGLDQVPEAVQFMTEGHVGESVATIPIWYHVFR
jgi:hypothetical protein